MCGRYTLYLSGEEMVDVFDLRDSLDWEPRYNIVPSEPIPMFGLNADETGLGGHKFRWGLIPRWVEDPDDFKGNLINARRETVAEKPSFRDSFRQRRGLIPSTGFYEWKQEDGEKQPYFISRTDDEPFCFAGIWDRWKSESSDRQVESCAILTTDATGELEQIHHRMPLIVPRSNMSEWLSPESAEQLSQRLEDHPDPGTFKAVPVDPQVNRPTVDDPSCIEPLT